MKNGTLNDFQKSFLARGTGQTLYTEKEFEEALAIAKAQIMQVAIETTKTAIAIEREECAKIMDELAKNKDTSFKQFEDTHDDGWVDACVDGAEAIRNRMNNLKKEN